MRADEAKEMTQSSGELELGLLRGLEAQRGWN